jgi:hypothetical protein
MGLVETEKRVITQARVAGEEAHPRMSYELSGEEARNMGEVIHGRGVSLFYVLSQIGGLKLESKSTPSKPILEGYYRELEGIYKELCSIDDVLRENRHLTITSKGTNGTESKIIDPYSQVTVFLYELLNPVKDLQEDDEINEWNAGLRDFRAFLNKGGEVVVKIKNPLSSAAEENFS